MRANSNPAVETQAPARASWKHDLVRLSGDPERGICGLQRGTWNGGWTFYCACGYCSPLRAAFSDGLDLIEEHWRRRA